MIRGKIEIGVKQELLRSLYICKNNSQMRVLRRNNRSDYLWNNFHYLVVSLEKKLATSDHEFKLKNVFKYIYASNGARTSCKEKFRNKNFQTEFVVAGGGFLSYRNHQLIKFKDEKRYRLLKQFCYYEKREISTFKKFPCEFFHCN